LVLRYKKKDDGATKYNYVIEKEFHPEPEDSNILSHPESRDPSKHDTPLLYTSRQATCNRSIIVTKVCETITHLTAKHEFLTYFESNDHVHLMEIDYKSKGTVVIVCRDWAGCKTIADKYAKTKMLDKEITFTLFTETEPSA
jgi:hypothetical protein